MLQEILLAEECEFFARQLGLPDLVAQANRQHAAARADGTPWTPLTIVRAFGLLPPVSGEHDPSACVLFAFAGTGSRETDGYEGMRVVFVPGEEAEAATALAKHSAHYDEQFIAEDLAERIRDAGIKPSRPC